MLLSNALLVDMAESKAGFLSSQQFKKTSALNFLISTSKSHLAVVPSLNSILLVYVYSINRRL
jgi:hypothetical protein